jgi:hypothetical protein
MYQSKKTGEPIELYKVGDEEIPDWAVGIKIPGGYLVKCPSEPNIGVYNQRTFAENFQLAVDPNQMSLETITTTGNQA